MRQNKSAIKQAHKEGIMLDYLGVIEGTFIPPTGRNLPPFSWSDLPGSLRARWNITRQNLWTGAKDFVSIWYQGWWKVKPSLPVTSRREIKDTAKALYEDIYGAFAKGDLRPVEDKMAQGFCDALRRHILERERATSREWRLERYVREPKVVSYRFAALPVDGEAAQKMSAKEQAAHTSGMVQAVVQIHSVQSLLTMKEKRVWNAETRKASTTQVPLNQRGEEISLEGAEEVRKATAKETTEYFVIQRKVMQSKPGPWHAWGMANESTPEAQKAEAGLLAARQKELEKQRALGNM
jgi:protein MBA1